ncbi:LPS export ABC transporter periplasmic protein LptC [candidate division KSB1 bacterium]|nr:LPS export ABC transporter periplasmic protein LptC [candidate division KSB1 bacterium]RQV99806.1 MAG: LPS export ABC transporter periplasmic protein LptC [candidate division KSB1 bacterium]
MKKYKKYKKYVWLLFFTVIVVQCSRDESTVMDKTESKRFPDQEIWDFEAKTTTNGKLEALIQAGHMQRFSKESLMLFHDGVHVDFYDDQGEHASVLTADKGEYDMETENVKASGNVVVVSDSGITLYTEELFYNRESDRIVSNTHVKVETDEGHILHGVGFESDAQMEFWEIRQPYDGVAPKGVDLSLDRFERKRQPDSTMVDSNVGVDTTVFDPAVVDSTRPDTVFEQK